MDQPRECLCCGQAFEPTCHVSRQKFCSRECCVKYNNARRYFSSVPMGTCPECGEVIEQSGERGRWRRFCSDGCRVAYGIRKRKEARQDQQRPAQICPNCGKEFVAEWGHHAVRRFCSDECRLEWWEEYHKAHPDEQPPEACAACGKALTGRHIGGSYCCRECYLQAMSGKRANIICAWCGEEFTAPASAGRIYCCHACAVAGRSAPGRRKGQRRLPLTDAEEWRKQLTQAAKKAQEREQETVARLVCGSMNMNNGLEGLVSVIRYGLQQNPYDGNIYVFRDGTGTMLKYLQWDGTSFSQGKRRAQSGSYPWPIGARGAVVDISIQEWQYLLTKSIVPAGQKPKPKPKKRGRPKKDGRKKKKANKWPEAW